MAEPLDYYDPGGLSAAFYDLLCQLDPDLSRDLELYAGLAPPGAVVLELGCGTGRVAFDLARRGHQVTGLDIAPSMLHRARLRLKRLPPEVQGRVTLLAGDMTDLELPGRFDLVLIPFFGLAHLPPARWPAVFANVAGRLAAGGKLAIHLPIARLMAAPPDRPPDEPVVSVAYGAGGERLALYVVSQTFEEGRFEQVLDYVMEDAEGREQRRSRERLVYYDADPRPIAAAAGLSAIGEPVELAGGQVFLFSAEGGLTG